ncbi:MAG: hypothetical protein MUE98_03535 [Rhodobacteraceae bacterium]|jgi:hypothetical protein|nr:hypothetical protein [Paracoccaceae bacterium]
MSFARAVALIAAVLVSACSTGDLDQPPEPLGDFRLGLNVVVGETAKQIPPTRGATAEEWEAALETEIDRRFGRYQGSGEYHLGVSVDAYALAIPGVPVVVKPRSVLVVSATVWDNATRQKLNGEVMQLTVLESTGFLTPDSIIGSGLMRPKAEQMQSLSFNAARAIEYWLKQNEDWFSPDPEVRAAARAATVNSSGKERPKTDRPDD